jgi:integrase
MATFEKRAGNWRAKIRRKGHETLSRTFDNKADAEEWAIETERDIRRGQYVNRAEAENTTLWEALDRYAREVVPAKRGARQELSRIKRWKAGPLAKRSLTVIRGADLASWRDERLAEGMSPTTVAHHLRLISHMFNVAIREWGLDSLSNPVTKIKVPPNARARDRRLECRPDVEGRAEEERLLAVCDASQSIWIGPLVRFALETAMRRGEILALRWEHVDLQRRVAVLPMTKNGELRAVPLSTRAIAALQSIPRSIDGRVFALSRQALQATWRKAAVDAGLADFRFHDLRHEATSRFFEKGLNPMEAAAITGHKTLAMLKRYTHLRAEDLAAKLG